MSGARLMLLKPRLATLGAAISTVGSLSRSAYDRRWRRLRALILHRDGGLCQPCMRDGRVTKADEVDHIIRKADGGRDEQGNLQSICRACHAAKTLAENRGQVGAG
jgi:5-methylcytosine-specific restriction protein A